MTKNRKHHSQSQRRRHSQRRHNPNRKPNALRGYKGLVVAEITLDGPPVELYDNMTVAVLREEAKQLGIKGTWRMTKSRLLEAIRGTETETL